MNSAVRAPPMCRKPVGEGAKRVTTGRAVSVADSLPLAMFERFLSNDVMATRQPTVPLGEEPDDAAMQQSPWRKTARLSSVADSVEAWLARAGLDRGPWLAVAFAGGIAAWFVLATPVEWVLAAAAGLIAALGAVALWRGNAARQPQRVQGNQAEAPDLSPRTQGVRGNAGLCR